jgi:hypothetical protein
MQEDFYRRSDVSVLAVNLGQKFPGVELFKAD